MKGKTKSPSAVAPQRWIFDTSVLVEGRYLLDVDWAKELGSHVEVLLPYVVVRELDKHKANQRKRLRDRARSLTAYFADHADRLLVDEGHHVREGVRMRLIKEEARMDKFPALDPTLGDDRIVATCLEARTKGPLKLLTYDTGLFLKAKANGIDAFRLAEHLLAHEEPDEEARLRKELAESKRRAPSIRILLVSGHEQGEHLAVPIVKVAPAPSHRVRSIMDGRIARLPRPTVMRTGNQIADGFMQIGFNNKVRENQEYGPKLESALAARQLAEEERGRTFELGMHLFNEGTQSATKVVIEAHLPEGFLIRPNKPLIPSLPPIPGSDVDAPAENAEPQLRPTPQWLVSEKDWFRGEIDEVLPHDSELVNPFVVTVPRGWPHGGCEVALKILARELASPVQCRLHLRFEVSEAVALSEV